MRMMRTTPGNGAESVECYAAPGYGKNDWQRNRNKENMLSPPCKSHSELRVRLAKPLYTGIREGPALKLNKPDAMRVRRDEALRFLE